MKLPPGAVLALSFGQERLWFLERLTPGDPTYVLPFALALTGPVDRDALARALGEITQRHEVLRTTYPLADGRPVVRVGEAAPVPLPVTHVDAATAEERAAIVQREVAAEVRRPFDLERGPVLRARLFLPGDDAPILLLSLHHLVADAWTVGILAGEIRALYGAFREGAQSPLGAPAHQYAEYAAWQRAWLGGEAGAASLRAWIDRLDGAPQVLELPADHPRPSIASRRGARHAFTVPADLRAALVAIGRRARATPFMTFLAAFTALLHRLTGQRELLVGTPIANRTLAETEAMVGFFLNTLALRSRVDAETSFRTLLTQVREECLFAYAHPDLPFEQLVSALAEARDLGRSPLIQGMFVHAKAPPSAAGRPALRLDTGTAKVDLTLTLTEGPNGIDGAIEYATDLFEPASIARIAGYFLALLHGIVAAPERPIDALAILGERERHQLLAEWNDTRVDYPRDARVVDLLDAQVARTPEAIAAVFEGESITYAALARRWRGLAGRLRASGVGRDTLVGLCVERGIGMLAGMLGVLAAGGAYLPLDPAYPSARLAFMLDDAAVAIVVTERAVVGKVPPGERRIMLLDGDDPALDPPIDPPFDPPIDPAARAGDRAYVIYTSGSTGLPKGVEIEHRAVVNFLVAMARVPGLAPWDRLLAVTSLSFDIAVLELLLPLTIGATVEIAPPRLAADGAALRARIERSAITVMQATPTTWRLLVEAGFAGGPGFRALVGGEASPPALVDALVARCGAVWNLYGPTETTVWSTIHRLGAGPIAIGHPRPIANTRALVLDERRALVPIGVAGELYLGGDGLARGYLGRPALTAERFVPDPFSHTEAARLYRTGDRCRVRADGAIELLGRLDQQVKLRGYRIELGEVEAVLARHPRVEAAVALIREDTPGDRRLCAYVVARDAGPSLGDELRALARASLPEPMVPTAYQRLLSLPMLPNGKLDRGALPAPDQASSPGETRGPPPRDETEARLATLFREVLGRRQVSASDDFFELGGHSLLAVQLLAAIHRAFGKELSLVALFQAPTVAALAALIREGGDDARWPALVAIKASGPRRPLFLVSRPNVNALGYAALALHLDPDRPVYGLQLQYPEEDELDRPYGEDEYDRWAARYVELLKGVQPEGPYQLAGMCEGGLTAFRMARMLEASGDEVAFLGMFDTWPEENTRRRFLDAIFVRERALRLRLGLGPGRGTRLGERAVDLGRGVARGVIAAASSPLAALRRVIPVEARPARSDVAPTAGSASYEARKFPGPRFVPPAIAAPITVFRVEAQPYWRIADPALGWRPRTTAGVEVIAMDGDHGTFFREPQVAGLGQTLAACLRRVDEALAATTASH